MRNDILSRRGSLLSAVSFISLSFAAPAAAQVAPTLVDEGIEQIVANHEVTPGVGSTTTGANFGNSPDVLDVGVNGVGQQIAFFQVSATSASLGLCTGTLINPRTVITAAHCLYSNPAHMYGSTSGTGGGTYGGFGTTSGIPLSFGFNATNRCLGVALNGCAVGTGAYEQWRAAGFRTVAAANIYNANQVWYNRGSQPVALGGGGEFANGDIALVTLDTHAGNIPTWALLFSPLDGPAHATITGYGGTGVGLSGIGSLAGIDYRRRAAENMVDALMSWHDQNTTDAIAGPNSTTRSAFQHAIYWTDFDDPNWSVEATLANPNFFTNTAPAGSRNNGYYDFNVLGGPEGTALPNEGSTAGGDSGGPLIIDQRWDIPVVAGVLTGSISYNGGLSTYGQMNVYPPLFQFWQEIVLNNPYKYVSALAGDGDWFDPTHWVQDMDPNYMVIGADGQLINSVPGTVQGGPDGATNRFGTVCFLNVSCNDVTGAPYTPFNGTALVTAGGPGSTGFVPNNVEPVNSATAGQSIQARYYDVTLRQAGTTTLSQSATIDVMTIDGPARLRITPTGTLNTWADYTQAGGWSDINGTLNTNEMLVIGGLLSGRGTINADFLTVVGGVVAPGGGDSVGTLNVNSDMILSSASSLFVDVTRNTVDLLNVSGVLALNGGSVVFNKVSDAAAPRHGTTLTFARGALGVDGTFGSAYTFQGVLRPFLTYTPTEVRAEFRAGSLVEILDGGSSTELAFASALDALRTNNYTSLYNLYGSIDWMNGSQLSAAFSALTPRVVGDAGALHERQSRLLLSNVGDRLSLLGTGKAQGLTMVGDMGAALQAQTGNLQSGKLGFGASNGGGHSVGVLPGGMTGFVSGGTYRSASSYGERNAYASQGGWHMAMGVELPLGDGGAIGTAAGVAEGQSSPAGDRNESRTTMAAAYAAMPLGDGFYVGGLLSAESSRVSLERMSTDGTQTLRMSGATKAARYSAVAEAGFAASIGSGLTLTPRAQLGYGRYTVGGFTEQGGETAMKLDDMLVERIDARLGARLDGRTKLAGVTIVPQISADYVRRLAGAGMEATVHFAAAPGEAIRLALGDSASGWAEFKGGVTFGDGPLTLGLSGQHATGGAMVDQRAQADIKLRF